MIVSPDAATAIAEAQRSRAQANDVVEAAEHRYLTGAEFHAKAYRAASCARIAVLDRGGAVDEGEFGALVLGAAVALHLAEVDAQEAGR